MKSFIKKIIKRREPVAKLKRFTKDFFSEKPYCIGEFTYGVPHVYFKEENSNLVIGKFCSIAGNVVIFLGGNHRPDWVTTYPFIEWAIDSDSPDVPVYNFSKGNVVIGNDVWIGYGSTILSGITIGNGAVVAAGSVVSRNIGNYEIWGGNPARFIKKRFSDAQIEKLEQIKWWDWPIEEIKAQSSLLYSSDIQSFIDKFIK
jgi:acetyltransferase-like isoleucine patch superfamily enzyme